MIDNPKMRTKVEQFNEAEIDCAFNSSRFARSKSWIIKSYRAEDAMRESEMVKEIGVLAISIRTRHPELNIETAEEKTLLGEALLIEETEREKLFNDLTGFGKNFCTGPLSLTHRSDIEEMVSKREKRHDDPEKYCIDIYRDAYGI